MNWSELKNSIPNDGFAQKYEVYRRARPTVTLVILRTVTDPILFRMDPERAETQELTDNSCPSNDRCSGERLPD
jgi:CRISPR-associated protein Csc2